MDNVKIISSIATPIILFSQSTADLLYEYKNNHINENSVYDYEPSSLFSISELTANSGCFSWLRRRISNRGKSSDTPITTKEEQLIPDAENAKTKTRRSLLSCFSWMKNRNSSNEAPVEKGKKESKNPVQLLRYNKQIPEYVPTSYKAAIQAEAEAKAVEERAREALRAKVEAVKAKTTEARAALVKEILLREAVKPYATPIKGIFEPFYHTGDERKVAEAKKQFELDYQKFEQMQKALAEWKSEKLKKGEPFDPTERYIFSSDEEYMARAKLADETTPPGGTVQVPRFLVLTGYPDGRYYASKVEAAAKHQRAIYITPPGSTNYVSTLEVPVKDYVAASKSKAKI